MEINTNPPSMASKNKKFILIGLLVVVVLVILCGLIFGDKMKERTLSVSPDAYQAVFLSNGQVYFGKISEYGKWIKLTNVFYLQRNNTEGSLQSAASGTTQNTNPAEPEFKLVKLGSEVHGPEDAMYIERSTVWFWENMKSDSKVMQAINKYQVK